MKKKLIAKLLALTGGVGCLVAMLSFPGASVVAQQAQIPTYTTQGTLASVGDKVGLYCGQGQSTAEIYVPTGLSGATVTVYTAPNIGLSSAPSPGPTQSPAWAAAPGGTTYATTITTFPNRLFVGMGSSAYVYAVLTATSSGSATAYISCSAAVAHAGGGGGGGGAVIAGQCISVTPTATPSGASIIANTCTPTPAPNIAVTTTPCGAQPSGGSFSVTVPACSVVAVSATACAYNSAQPTSGPNNAVIIPVCVTPNPFEAAVLARSDVTHFWKMHDNPDGCASGCTPGPCPTAAGGIADSIASGATGNPSPVPLTVVTTSPLGPPTCGMPPIAQGLGSSIAFCQNSTNQLGCGQGSTSNSYLSIPAAAVLNGPFTLFCVFNSVGQSNLNNFLWTTDGSARFQILINTSGAYEYVINTTGRGTVTNASRGFMTTTVGATGASGNGLYLNAIPVVQPTVTPPAANGTAGAIGVGWATSVYQFGFGGTIEDCGEANTAWSQGTIQYLYSLIGL